ncbi:MAG: hypothetical protein ACPGFA_10115, partial [Pikeienuella sp.]
MRWVDEIRDVVEKLGGAARLEDLYSYIEKTTRRVLTKEWKATIRRTIEDHSSDSANHRSTDFFAHLDRGFWALRGASVDRQLIEERAALSGDQVVELVLVREHLRRKPSRGPFENQAFTIAHADN